MHSTVHVDRTRTGYTDDEHVYLVVDMLPNASTRLEPHQVGVEIAAPFKSPDHPRSLAGRSGDLAEVHRNFLHTVPIQNRVRCLPP